jgi:hypothetical protein
LSKSTSSANTINNIPQLFACLGNWWSFCFDSKRWHFPKFTKGTNYAWSTIIQIAQENSDAYDFDDHYGRVARSDSSQTDSFSAKLTAPT